jgi:hypothetical protein
MMDGIMNKAPLIVPLKLRWEGMVYFTLLGLLFIGMGCTVFTFTNVPLKFNIFSGLIIGMGIFSIWFLISANILKTSFISVHENKFVIKKLLIIKEIAWENIIGIKRVHQFYTGSELLEIKYFKLASSNIRQVNFPIAMLPRGREDAIINEILKYLQKHPKMT